MIDINVTVEVCSHLHGMQHRNVMRRNAFSVNILSLLNVFDYCGAAEIEYIE